MIIIGVLFLPLNYPTDGDNLLLISLFDPNIRFSVLESNK